MGVYIHKCVCVDVCVSMDICRCVSMCVGVYVGVFFTGTYELCFCVYSPHASDIN